MFECLYYYTLILYILSIHVLLHLEARPAAAALLGVGVVENEPAADQLGLEVQFRPVQVQVALGVAHQLYPVGLKASSSAAGTEAISIV